MLILLIGPKGSGKSYIGRLLEERLGVHFFHVELLWMAYYADCGEAGRGPSIEEGIARAHPSVAKMLEEHSHVCVETTGASREILEDLMRLGEGTGLLLVRVKAPLEVCLKRIAARDQAHQIPVDEAMIRRIFELSEALDLPFDVVLENTSLTKQQLLVQVASLLRPDGEDSR